MSLGTQLRVLLYHTCSTLSRTILKKILRDYAILEFLFWGGIRFLLTWCHRFAILCIRGEGEDGDGDNGKNGRFGNEKRVN